MVQAHNNSPTVAVADLINETAENFQAAYESGKLFFGHGTDNAVDEAAWLVMHVLSLPFDGDESVLSQPVTGEALEATRALAKRRITERLPLAYLTHQAWFCGLPFYVDQRVLVPRSPMAELIDQKFQPWLLSPPGRILDLCTGSGCIGIACAHVFCNSEVILSDLSTDALAVAEKNIEAHHLGERVHVIQSDLFENLRGQQFDLIVSNPPYVDAADLAAMPEEYRHEPELGLGSGIDGLDFTRKLLDQAGKYLTERGLLVVEVGNSWEALQAEYPTLPFTWLDLEYGGHGVFVLTREQLVAYAPGYGL